MQKRIQNLEKAPKTSVAPAAILLPPDLAHTTWGIAGDSPTRFSHSSLSQYEVVTHFSGSPYKGARVLSQHESASQASTSGSRLRRNHKFFKNSVVPFLQKSIDTFQHSDIFGDDAKTLGRKLEAFKNCGAKDKDSKVQLMVEILDGLNHLQQQCVAVLNRELQSKKISSQLEFLFTIFLDPEQYGLLRQDHIKKLRQEMLEIMLEIWDHNPVKQTPEESPTRACSKRHNRAKLKETKATANLKNGHDRAARIRVGLQACTDALKHYSDKGTEPVTNVPPACSKTSRERFEKFRELHSAERSRLKQSRDALEFIPIGYDEMMLAKMTPDRKSDSHSKFQDLIQITPLTTTAKEEQELENDPLQLFITEFLADNPEQDESTASVMSDF